MNPRIIPGSSLGPLTLDMSTEDARRLLDAGGDLPRIRGGPPPALEHISYRSGPYRGVTLHVKGSRIHIITLVYTPDQLGCATSDGIHLLSTDQDVTTAYGPPPQVHHIADTPPVQVFIYDGKGITFGIVQLEGKHIVGFIQVFNPGTYCTIFPTFCSP